MYKVVCLVLAAGVSVLGVTQEELAQYVAQQQTASLGASPVPQARRQAYLLQPQAKAYQPQPTQTVYTFQPKAAPQYQSAAKYQAESGAEPQYYQQAANPAAQYYSRPQPQPQQPLRTKLVRPGQQQEEEEYEPPQPYQFGFDIKDDEFTNYQNRKEQREGDKISGSYSVVDSDGYIRTVTYTADPLGGFKADVVREPTDIKVKIPTPHPQDVQQQLQYSAPARKQQTQQYLQASQAGQPKLGYTQAVQGQRAYSQVPAYQQAAYLQQQQGQYEQ